MQIRKSELSEVIAAREKRAAEISALNRKFNAPVLCFTMDLDGPVRNSPMIRRAFDIGLVRLKMQFKREDAEILYEKVIHDYTGNEAYFITSLSAADLKILACELEDADELGGLYSMQVFQTDPEKLKKAAISKPHRKLPSLEIVTRESMGIHSRICPVCGAAGKGCSISTGHTAEETAAAVRRILVHGIFASYAALISERAGRALLFEIAVTPKPGLIDRNNSGSLKDKDYYTLMSSTAALFPFFEKCAKTGLKTAALEPAETFRRIRILGKSAERKIILATGDKRMHKGALFILGTLCAAAGRLSAISMGCPYVWQDDPRNSSSRGTRLDQNCEDFLADKIPLFGSAEKIAAECKSMMQGISQADLKDVTSANAKTNGEKIFAWTGINGIRGEMENGLPSVMDYGLPALRQFLDEGRSFDEAGALTMLCLMGVTADTAMITCTDQEAAEKFAAQAAQLFHSFAYCESKRTRDDMLLALDEDYTAHGLTPNGSGNLLAACFLLYFLENSADSFL